MHDIQTEVDHRGVAIDEVGISGLRYPVTFDDGHTRQTGIADISVTVGLLAERRGTLACLGTVPVGRRPHSAERRPYLGAARFQQRWHAPFRIRPRKSRLDASGFHVEFIVHSTLVPRAVVR